MLTTTSISEAAPVGPPVAATAMERLATALDGRELVVGRDRWRLTVFGVFEHEDRRWVQLGIEGPGSYLLTLELTEEQAASDAVGTLRRWLARPAGTILKVA
jgi:hypothetical protein